MAEAYDSYPSAEALAGSDMRDGRGGVHLQEQIDVWRRPRRATIGSRARSASDTPFACTAIAGTILVSSLTEHAYGVSMIVLAAIGLVGLVAALFLPGDAAQSGQD